MLMNAVSSAEYLHVRHCKMLEMPSECFRTSGIYLGRSSAMPCYTNMYEGALAQYTFADKECKMKLNHGCK